MKTLDVIDLYRKAGSCTVCFDKNYGNVPIGGCRLPQPRWIGPQYWREFRRVVVCMINPGTSGAVEEEFETLLKNFYAGKAEFDSLNLYFKKVMPRWGMGAYLRSIKDDLHLNLEKIALMNLALCPMSHSSGKNYYPRAAIYECYKRHTREIMKALKPQIIVLCGSATHELSAIVEQDIGCKTVLAPHYGARMDKEIKSLTYRGVRKSIHAALGGKDTSK